MANRALFNKPTRNRAGGVAMSMQPRAALTQLAMTGSLSDTFYTSAQVQLEELVSVCSKVDSAFIGQLAVYARTQGYRRTCLRRCASPSLLVTSCRPVPSSRRCFTE